MSEQDFYHQYRWALERLTEAFGADRITLRPPGDGGQVLAVEVRNSDGASQRPVYVVVFKDHLLHDLNKHSHPGIFLEGDIQRANAYFEGKQPLGITLP